ncbi:hypothetical protein CPB84DRAFT_352795 [Gymnopilus junonius]|uniref:Uncharacterized protein n=1 Tax=Gymnopilus junonius TaxID=109634 RepID=A0A9P5NAA3_GYMJU|nr:hypothetical protein CPB84DRAFT_352795 [Gymnopilus junonius]
MTSTSVNATEAYYLQLDSPSFCRIVELMLLFDSDSISTITVFASNSHMSIRPGDIFVTLFLRSDLTSFHWALTICSGQSGNDGRGKDDEGGGRNKWLKMHAKNTHGGVWRYECLELEGNEDGVLEDASVLIQIGNLATTELATTISQMDTLFREIPHRTDRIDGGRKTKYDCIIWLRMAVRKLMEVGILNLNLSSPMNDSGPDSGGKGVGVVKLEEECRMYGEGFLRIQKGKKKEEDRIMLVKSRFLTYAVR